MADAVEHKPKIRRRRSTKARLPLPETIDPLDIAVKQIADGERGPGESVALILISKQSRLIDAELSFVAVQTLSQRVGLALKAAALLLVIGAVVASLMLLTVRTEAQPTSARIDLNVRLRPIADISGNCLLFDPFPPLRGTQIDPS